jgi:hypothetical protein
VNCCTRYSPVDALAVDADHHALGAEALAQGVDEFRIRQGRRIHGDLLGAGAEHLLGFADRANTARDAKRNVEQARDARHPAAIDDGPLGLAVMS